MALKTKNKNSINLQYKNKDRILISVLVARTRPMRPLKI